MPKLHEPPVSHMYSTDKFEKLKQSQADLCEVEASLAYRERASTAGATEKLGLKPTKQKQPYVRACRTQHRKSRQLSLGSGYSNTRKVTKEMNQVTCHQVPQ